MNLRSFSLASLYLDTLNMSNASELLRILFRFKKRKGNSLSYVHVLHKTSNWEVSRRSRAVDVKVMHVAARVELLF